MKPTPILIVVALLVATGCGSSHSVDSTPLPGWLIQLIAQQESEPVANPPAWIARYSYHGETVYYLPPRCCDVFSVLYDARGEVLCNPDGGITGRGDGRCPDFYEERQDEKVIWRDGRGVANSDQ